MIVMMVVLQARSCLNATDCATISRIAYTAAVEETTLCMEYWTELLCRVLFDDNTIEFLRLISLLWIHQ